MDFKELTDYLFSLRAHGSRLGLERMRALCARLGNPERTLRAIHIAGTNGKGSVCALLESALRAAGYKVGLYTSPHLVYLGERTQIDRRAASPKALCRLVAEMRPHADALARESPELAPTFFEFMTAAAFLSFAQEGVDVAVLETGLGGRFDSTNVVEQPLATVVTSIGLDHIEYLGDTVEKIAFEKGGIFKKGAPAVLGNVPPQAEAVLRACARDRGASAVRTVRERFARAQDYPECALRGAHQRANAAAALLALETARDALPRVSADAVARGFAAVDWPGRWQDFRLKDGRTLILEGAHNPEGAAILDAELQTLAANGRDIAVIVGVCGQMRAEAILPVVARRARSIYLVRVAEPRATPPETMREILRACGRSERVFNADLAALLPAPATCAIPEAQGTPVICGSLYLVGEALARLDPERWNAHGLGLQDLLPTPPRAPRANPQ